MDAPTIRLDFLRTASRPSARWRWYRVVVERLARALRSADPAAILTAGALASVLLEQEESGTAARRRAAALLDAALITAGDELDERSRALLEQRAEVWLASGTPVRAAGVAAELRDSLHGVVAARPSQAAAAPLDAAVQAFLADHLHEGARLGDLARRLGYSASHCSALVRQATGERFSVLRRRMQLERAFGLLRSGTSVKAAALGAGFSEAAYFSRVFARRYGVSPSRWREIMA